MGDRYWVRHATLAGYQGPLTLEQIRAAVAGKRVPLDSEVRMAANDPGVLFEKLDEKGWQPAYSLLGVDRPPLPVTVPSPPPDVLAQALDSVRGRSRYRGARQMAFVLLVVALLAAAIAGVAGIVVALIDRDWVVVAAVLCGLCLHVCGVLVAYHMFLMLADIADCHVRAEADRSATRSR